MYFDQKETFSPEEREEYLLERLRETLTLVQEQTEYYPDIIGEINPASFKSLVDLQQLPVTRKSDLIHQQQQSAPFGGLNGMAPGKVARLFQSPGPINEPEGKAADWWRLGRAFYAAGFRSGDIVHNTLSYHLSPGGFIIDSGARACGCAVIPAGVGQTEQQLQVISSLKPNGYAGTPSFLKILLDKADAENIDVSSIEKALVTGEPLPEALRQSFIDRGISCLQTYATADAGLIAYEVVDEAGMMVAEDIIFEILKPGTGEPVESGETGEIVVTTFNTEYPLIRFATGDLTAELTKTGSSGRTNRRIKGWLGRADQSTKVKGLFVHPNQVMEVIKRHPEISKARLLVETINGRDAMTLVCESDKEIDLPLVESSLNAVCRLKGKVSQLEPGKVTSDGRLIEDLR
ncbi:AMP-dependent synthetase [Endozoicomonas sp. OPT23]|uniref:phenylacetate--CoA ligase family protein n=1 Tax=Endozoicomonas sp. OPT23 TaxID=2072845 RepID=UPI00129A96B7|nr:AMP-binding protein [Endozoicomonas sp. OPT23]MRI34117.1 AMP-dependent synthetase [Endozoicomonas sp. OPT23]